MTTPIRVPLLDLRKTHAPLRRELGEIFDRVLESGRFIFGPELEAFESEVAETVGVEHALAVSSGTDALLLALMGLGVEAGDEVVCPDFSFFATAGSPFRLGAVPTFADISAESFLSGREHFESRITDRTRVLIVVHLYGRCADMDPILELARERDLPVLEDAAQALGASSAGRPAGAMGRVGCFSCFPTKNLGGFGDGGLVTTRDSDLHDRMKALRNHGEATKYLHARVGGNFRMDALQAALLRAKLPHLETYNRRRRENAAGYARLFEATGLTETDMKRAESLGMPLVVPSTETEGHIFHQYVLRVRAGEAERSALREHLLRAGVQTEVYYPRPLHLQECFAHLDSALVDCPAAEEAAEQVLALPIHPDLEEEQLAWVVEAISDYYESGSSR